MARSGTDPIEPTPGRATAHALVRRRRGASLARCFARLSAADGVRGCDRVTGGWDLVLRLHAADEAALERLARGHLERFDVEAYELHYGAPPRPGEDGPARAHDPGVGDERGGPAAAHLSAYAVVRIDPAAPLETYRRLCADGGVVACDLTHGGREAVVRVDAPTAAELARALSGLRAERGVVSLRIFPVVGPPDVTAGRREARTRAAP